MSIFSKAAVARAVDTFFNNDGEEAPTDSMTKALESAASPELRELCAAAIERDVTHERALDLNTSASWKASEASHRRLLAACLAFARTQEPQP